MLIVKYVDLLARRPVLGLVASFLAFIGLIYYAIAVFAGTAGLQSGG